MTRYEKQKQNVEGKWTPEQRAELAARQREKGRLRMERLRADPVAWEAHLVACRARDTERYRVKMERLKADPAAYRKERDKQNAREQKRLALHPRKPVEKTTELAERQRERNKRYSERHPERRRMHSAAYRQRKKAIMTPEEHESERVRIAAYHKEYRAKNAALVKAKKAAYNATPEGREFRRLAALRHSRKVGHLPRTKLPPEIALERARASFRKYQKTHTHIRRARHAVRYKTDPKYRMLMSLRSRVRNFIKGKDKSASTLALLGCTMDEFKAHIEKQFEPWMSWANYGCGKNCWSLDHFVACSLYDLSKPEQQAKCFHYSNIRPMLHVLNIIKGDKLPAGVPHPNPPHSPLDNSSSCQQRCPA